MISGKTECREVLVLSQSPFKENSSMVTLASQEGLLSVLARGVYKPKSPLKPLLVTGTLLNLEFVVNDSGPNLAKSLLVKEDNTSLIMDYPKSMFLLFLEEVTMDLFHYGDRYPFDEVKQILSALRKEGDPLSLALLFLGSVYRTLGLEMDIHECVSCHRKEEIVSYSLKEGGYLCKNCLNPDGQEKVRDKLSLYLLKYSFLPITEELLKKKVPVEEGKGMLLELSEHLVDYFDLHELRSLALFLGSL